MEMVFASLVYLEFLLCSSKEAIAKYSLENPENDDIQRRERRMIYYR
jgi:hypothetical protein